MGFQWPIIIGYKGIEGSMPYSFCLFPTIFARQSRQTDLLLKADRPAWQAARGLKIARDRQANRLSPTNKVKQTKSNRH